MPSGPSRRSGETGAPRVVFDSNIWVSIILKPHGHYAQMVEEVSRVAEIFTAEAILTEVREASLRPDKRKYRLTERAVEEAIAAIRELAVVLTHLPHLEVIQEDPDDNAILACAVQAGADYLVSYDPHLLRLEKYQGIKILKPQELLSELRG